MFRLERVTRDNWRDGLHVRASEEQTRFVADYQPVLLVILAKAAVQVGEVEWWPFLLKNDATTVGIVAVADDRERLRALTIFHLLIDEHEQRRGYGRAALQEIIELSRQADRCDALRLTVHPHNAAAIRMYHSAGFHVTGTDDDGELRMSRRVQPASSSWPSMFS